MGPAVSTNPLICSTMARHWVGRLQLTWLKRARDTSLRQISGTTRCWGTQSGVQHSYLPAMLCS